MVALAALAVQQEKRVFILLGPFRVVIVSNIFKGLPNTLQFESLGSKSA